MGTKELEIILSSLEPYGIAKSIKLSICFIYLFFFSINY